MKLTVKGYDFDGAAEATVTIDRERLLFKVRPKYAREEAVYPLAAVAVMVLWKAAKERVK